MSMPHQCSAPLIDQFWKKVVDEARRHRYRRRLLRSRRRGLRGGRRVVREDKFFQITANGPALSRALTRPQLFYLALNLLFKLLRARYRLHSNAARKGLDFQITEIKQH